MPPAPPGLKHPAQPWCTHTGVVIRSGWSDFLSALCERARTMFDRHVPDSPVWFVVLVIVWQDDKL